jgi:DNA-binding Lrp family transcriptional regulator
MADSQELGALDQFDLKLLAVRDFVNGVVEKQEAYALTGDADYLLKVAAPDLSGLARIISDLILPQASVAHVKSSIVLTTLEDSHRLPPRAAKSAS